MTKGWPFAHPRLPFPHPVLPATPSLPSAAAPASRPPSSPMPATAAAAAGASGAPAAATRTQGPMPTPALPQAAGTAVAAHPPPAVPFPTATGPTTAPPAPRAPTPAPAASVPAVAEGETPLAAGLVTSVRAAQSLLSEETAVAARNLLDALDAGVAQGEDPEAMVCLRGRRELRVSSSGQVVSSSAFHAFKKGIPHRRRAGRQPPARSSVPDHRENPMSEAVGAASLG